MENKGVIKYRGGLIKHVGNAISVTNKLLASIEPQLIPYRKKDKWGFCSPDKKIAINCKYDKTFPFSEELGEILLNNKYGYINKNDEIIIDTKYDLTSAFSNGFAVVGENKKFGIINKKNEQVLKPVYSWINRPRLDGKNFIATLNGKVNLFDKYGNKQTDIEYERMDDFVDDIASFKLNNKFGIIDRKGEEVIQNVYDSAYVFSRDFILVNIIVGHHFYIDINNKKVSTQNKAFASLFGEGLGINPDLKTMKYGFIDLITHETVIPFIYEEAWPFENGLARVKFGNKYGYIDKHQNQIIPCKYEDLGDFKNGLAYFKVNDRYGYINVKDQEVIPALYEKAFNFENEIVKVYFKNMEGYISKRGTEYWEN